MLVGNTTRQSFGTLFRFSSYTDCNGYSRQTQNTTAKRSDLDYIELAKIAKRRFSEFERINVMPMNVSDGTEAYMLAHAFIKVMGKRANEKIFPIEASDVDSFIINNFGKKGVVSFEPEDIEYFGKDFNNYFEEIEMSELPNINGYSLRAKAFKLKPAFKELFRFNVEDFQSRIKKVKDEGNSIVIIRNCLAQAFGWPEAGLICHRVGEILKDTSLFIPGQYDRENLRDMDITLKSLCDFKEIGKNIFSKNYKNKNYLLFSMRKLFKNIKPKKFL